MRPKKMMNTREITEHIDLLSEQIKYNPNSEYFEKRGSLLKQLGNLEESERDFSKSFQIDPQNIDALINRGTVRWQLRKFELAISDFQNAWEITEDESKRTIISLELSRTFEERGDFEASVKILTNLINTRGRIFQQKLFLYSKSIDDFISALRFSKTQECFYELGKVYMEIKSTKKSVEYFTLGISLCNELECPVNPAMFFNRGISFYHLKNYRNSEKDFNTYIYLKTKNNNDGNKVILKEAIIWKLRLFDAMKQEINGLMFIISLCLQDINYLEFLKEPKIKTSLLKLHSSINKMREEVKNRSLRQRKVEKNFFRRFEKTTQLRVERLRKLFDFTGARGGIISFQKTVPSLKSVLKDRDDNKIIRLTAYGDKRVREYTKLREREKHIIRTTKTFNSKLTKRKIQLNLDDQKTLFRCKRLYELRKIVFDFHNMQIGFLTEVSDLKLMNRSYKSAIKYRRIQTEERLVDFKEDQKILTREKLYIAITKKKWMVIEKWTRFDQINNLNMKFGEQNNTLLHFASMHGIETLIVMLLSKGVGMKQKNKNRKTAVDICCTLGGIRKRCLEIFQFWKKYADDYVFEGNFQDGVFSGKGKIFRRKMGILFKEKLILIFEGNFVRGKREGTGKEYYTNGNVRYYGNFVNDLRDGQGVEYFENNGKVKFRGIFKKGEVSNVSSECNVKQIDLTPFMKKIDYTRDYIGGGRFSDVFRTTFNEKECIAKVFHKPLIEEEWIQHEIQIHSLICNPGHPNIIKMLAYSPYSNKMTGLLQEFAHKGSVSQMIVSKDQNISWKLKLKIIYGLSKGMVYLHHIHNVIHYDLKWSNICLNKHNTVKIIDFGLSKAVESFRESIKHSRVKGTGFYIAPEISKYGPVSNKKSDVFSFGIMLFELLVETMNPFKVNFKKIGHTHSIENRIVNDPNYRPKIDNFPKFKLHEKHCK